MKNFLMRSRFSFIFFSITFLILVLVAISCRKAPYNDYTHSEGLKPIPGTPWLPSTPYNYPNAINNNLITLGRVLFYDKNLSADNSVSCGSCHQQANGFADNKSLSNGYNGLQTIRNAHTLVSTNGSKFWDGRVSSDTSNITPSGGGGSGYGAPSQASPIVSVPFQSHVELNMTDENTLCTKLAALSYYPYLFEKAFQSGSITLSQIEIAIASYIGTITASNSTYDQAYPANGSNGSITLTQIEQAGMAVFNGKGKCSVCHITNSSFTGGPNQFEDIGLDVVYKDLGRGAITKNPSDNGKFHVPTLKNVALSAPYMHDGRFTTLNQVVDFFSDSIKSSPNLSSVFSSGGTAIRLGLTPYEKSSLIAFLQTLTDKNLVTDIRYSDPFKH